MITKRRRGTLTVMIVMAAAFLVGSFSAAARDAAIGDGPGELTLAQRASVQAANAMVISEPTFVYYLPFHHR